MAVTMIALAVCGPAALLLYGIATVLYRWIQVLLRRRRMPPGPFPLPLVGNIFQLPAERQWKRLEEWSQTFKSPIITYWEGSKPTIVCNDAWTISDLNDRRANIYSSRPYGTVKGKLFGLYHMNQAGLPYGDKWRLHRKLTHAATNASIVQQYQSFQGPEAKILVYDCLEEPDDFVSNIERYTVSVVSTIAWGRRVANKNDTVLKVAQAYVGSSSLALPGRCYTEAMPFLAKLPHFLNSLPATMKDLADSSNKFFYALSEEGARQPQENFAKRLLREKQEHGLGKIDIANLTGNFIGAGVDTTASSMLTFVLAATLNRDVQEKAHEELDRIVGRDRSPAWSDEPQLPYIRAIVQEVLRWRPVFPLGGPQHCPIQDDEYKGYLIPKGTAIMGNLYAINRNPREYPEPEQFRPERFIDELERPFPVKRGMSVFGWGRRVCSGEPLALQSLFFTIASLLWAFNIEPGLDENGREVKPDPDGYSNSQVCRPLLFKARFTPRSAEIAEIVRDDARRAVEKLSVFDGETKVTHENSSSVILDTPSLAYEKA